MKTVAIPLQGGKENLVAIVDQESYQALSQHVWHFVPSKTSIGYAYRRVPGQKRGSYKFIYMHDAIMQTPNGLEVDHINHNGLDNRKENLRLGTRSQNRGNQRKSRKSCSSRFKGVYWYKEYGNWRVDIQVEGSRRFLGYFDDEVKAALAYDHAAKKFWGDFALLNFPEQK